MTAPVFDDSLSASFDECSRGSDGDPAREAAAAIRARAVEDVRRLRALARIARSDGLPKSALRAANATAAAYSVLRHARRASAPGAMRSAQAQPAAMAE